MLQSDLLRSGILRRNIKSAATVLIQRRIDQAANAIVMNERILSALEQDPLAKQLLPKKVWQIGSMPSFKLV